MSLAILPYTHSKGKNSDKQSHKFSLCAKFITVFKAIAITHSHSESQKSIKRHHGDDFWNGKALETKQIAKAALKAQIQNHTENISTKQSYVALYSAVAPNLVIYSAEKSAQKYN